MITHSGLELADMTEERIARRLTTIFAADVAGYSRLSSQDEESTMRTLRSYRQLIDKLIARHDGRIFGTAGDSVIAEFGSAVEAVRCAMSVQDELRVRNSELPEERQMLFRIGINVGDVMVEDGNLFGDGVNIAARIEALAQPGGVSISGSTFEQVNRKLSVHFEDTGQQSVKNIADPISTFAIMTGPAPIARKGLMGRKGQQRRKSDAVPGRRNIMIFALSALVSLSLGAGAMFAWQYWAKPATPESAGITTSPEGASALSVRQVTYGRNGKASGKFVQLPENRWRDERSSGKPVEYEETNRDGGTIFLQDRASGVHLQLDLRSGKIYFSSPKRPQRRAIYEILKFAS